MTGAKPPRWKPLQSGDGRDDAEWLLFCPFAGGSAGAFASWRSRALFPFPCALATYPGRDHRHADPLLADVCAIARDIGEALLDLPEARRDALILVGHSMGAQVAFEICKMMEAVGCGPAALVLSGCQAPHLQGRRLLTGLDDCRFVDMLTRIGGCGPELRDNPGLLSVFLPLLRADFAATEFYRHDNDGHQIRVRTPTLLMWGGHDEEANAAEVNAWSDWVSGTVMSVELAGDHFYPTRRPLAFSRAVLEFTRTHGRLAVV